MRSSTVLAVDLEAFDLAGAALAGADVAAVGLASGDLAVFPSAGADFLVAGAAASAAPSCAFFRRVGLGAG